ncbi:heme biosynthesis HemY N-terminal domain-containing protein [Thiopseudomonas denitrificans]|uniref:heme biosynthesis HemY N-terminal domain-containing protein n=1 Tax=Thiopseudomonas denitrificans TaxID=1501432 RepID=UPI000C771E40|nr:heme biosynthesis HemY N-terminal domain-containing protein [Thiopseudomonas denitrificans]
MKKRTFLLLLIAILLAAGLGMLVVEHQGYVLITWKNIRFESTLWVFLACIAVLLAGLYLLRMLACAVLASLGWVNPWSARNRKKRLDEAVNQGMLEFSRGNWQPALRQLSHAAKTSPQPLPYILAAARAAEKLQQRDTADQLLEEARTRLPESDLAIILCQAELYQQRGQQEQAQQLLQNAQRHNSENPELIERLYHVLLDNRDWGGLIGLVPDLYKIKSLSEGEVKAIEQRAWQGRLQAAGDLQQLNKVWNPMSSSLHRNASTVLAYCSQLITLGHAGEAEGLLRQQLEQNVDVALLQAYAQIPHADPERALQTAEGWLRQVPDDAMALFALGRLAVQARQWGRARDYYQSSLERRPTPQVYAELARLLNQMGDYKTGNELLATGIRLLERQNGDRID